MKRCLDVMISLAGIVIAAPLLLFLSAGVYTCLGKPVFFRQVRPGKDGNLFQIIKFRTMKDACDSKGVPLEDAQRMTKFGSFLRASSLDELPELFNVLKGEMSLVGPRPLLTDYLPLYTDKQARRHDVRPGITGWAQVSGRNSLSWEDRFLLDVWYVDNRSTWLDLKILCLTISKVLKREGITEEGNCTMSVFTGSSDGIQKDKQQRDE